MDTRLKDIDMHLETLEQALALLEEVLSEPFSALVRDAAIHRFEYTFELSWKLLRRIAQVEGQQADSPWQAIRVAAETGLLQNIDLWFEMVECRNSVTMTFMPDGRLLVTEKRGRLYIVTEEGDKSWDINGDTADIVGTKITLSNVDANSYGEQKMNLTAETGEVDQVSGNMHLKTDVVITSEEGQQLTTDSLNWDKKLNSSSGSFAFIVF